jgi:hypothetical protein
MERLPLEPLARKSILRRAIAMSRPHSPLDFADVARDDADSDRLDEEPLHEDGQLEEDDDADDEIPARFDPDRWDDFGDEFDDEEPEPEPGDFWPEQDGDEPL